ncbi:PIN domain-containing protein [Variovorax guangxiensis]|uniref:PIN domain-containing protein n=1 Tax=Variovorax guangxiensis TaxID=1775474 RepID=UPI00286116F2|nr:PIN domain-containing protein [Variovorax guangxiensis]MDR6857876.1 hypothetical protein [Variovorax guangxiensis]
MATSVHLLVDLENVQPSPKEVEAWLGDAGQAWVFYGPHQLKRKAVFELDSPRSTLIPISRAGSNSLDFHLVFYLGYLAAKHPQCRFVVLAKDTGYDPPIAHARTLAFSVKRMNSLPVGAPTSSTPSKRPPSVPVTNGKAVGAPKKVAANAKSPKGQEAPAAPKAMPAGQKKSGEKLPIEIYRDLLKDLKASNRPGSLSALKRHIQTKFGPAPAPQKVQRLVERLLTSDVIHLADNKLCYGPPKV